MRQISSIHWSLMAGMLLSGGAQAAEQPEVCKIPLEVALKKATCNGRYGLLLRQIYAPTDAEHVGHSHHRGYQTVTNYAGTKQIPNGHWVYVYPYWYVWGTDSSKKATAPRRWGTEQLLGKPDTTQAGDIPTAWASKSPDDSEEWLLLEYPQPVIPTAVVVHETYNPGALVRITAFRLNGKEVEVWKGRDPTSDAAMRGVSKLRLHVPFKTNRIKLYLDSPAIQGWNEIDAVGLQSEGTEIQWASQAAASSCYADQQSPPMVVRGAAQMPRQR